MQRLLESINILYEYIKTNITRAQELEAGIVLAILGFTMTFAILIVLTLSIKIMSVVVTRYVRSREKRKPKPVEVEKPKPEVEVKPVVPEAKPTLPVPPEIIAAAITGVRMYLKEKTRLRKPIIRAPRINYWVFAWRMDSSFNLNDLDYTHWNKSRRIRW